MIICDCSWSVDTRATLSLDCFAAMAIRLFCVLSLITVLKWQPVNCVVTSDATTSMDTQLYFENRKYLTITDDHQLIGSNDNWSDATIFRRKVRLHDRITIIHPKTCRYVCIDKCGDAYTSYIPSQDCLFHQNYSALPIDREDKTRYQVFFVTHNNTNFYLGMTPKGIIKKHNTTLYNMPDTKGTNILLNNPNGFEFNNSCEVFTDASIHLNESRDCTLFHWRAFKHNKLKNDDDEYDGNNYGGNCCCCCSERSQKQHRQRHYYPHVISI